MTPKRTNPAPEFSEYTSADMIADLKQQIAEQQQEINTSNLVCIMFAVLSIALLLIKIYAQGTI